MWRNQLVPQLSLKQSDTLLTQYRHIEHLCEEVWCQNINFYKMIALWTWPFFPVSYYIRVMLEIVHTWGSQLVPELFLKLFDTLHIQYRYNKHVQEEVSCQKKYIWQSSYLSNLAILDSLCILDSSFLYWPLLCGVYLISIAYCPFFVLTKKLVCTLFLEPTGRFWPKFMCIIIGIFKRFD